MRQKRTSLKPFVWAIAGLRHEATQDRRLSFN